jgi:hypothetical protein
MLSPSKHVARRGAPPELVEGERGGCFDKLSRPLRGDPFDELRVTSTSSG